MRPCDARNRTSLASTSARATRTAGGRGSVMGRLSQSESRRVPLLNLRRRGGRVDEGHSMRDAREGALATILLPPRPLDAAPVCALALNDCRAQ
eukprot:scaffold280629_cov36-Tisochrysis_lutea.AAC.6